MPITLHLGVIDGNQAIIGAMFYTYIHREKDVPGIDGIFYVGKGCRRRAWENKRRGTLWDNRVAEADGFIVEIIHRWSTEQEAFDHECDLIAKFREQGARLVNLTYGGDGVPLLPEVIKRRAATLNATNQKPEVKHRRRVAMRLMFENAENKQKHLASVRATCQIPEILAKKQAAIARVQNDPEIQARRIASMKLTSSDDQYRERKRQIAIKNGQRPPTYHGADHPMARKIICIETKESFLTVRFAVAWLKSNGLSKASATAIVAVCRGRQLSAYKYHWKYEEIVQ